MNGDNKVYIPPVSTIISVGVTHNFVGANNTVNTVYYVFDGDKVYTADKEYYNNVRELWEDMVK